MSSLSNIRADEAVTFIPQDENKLSPLSTIPAEVFLIVASFLDKKSLTALEEVCKKLYQLVNDDILWVDHLARQAIIPIDGRAKEQAVAAAATCCDFLFKKLTLTDAEKFKSKTFDVFEAKSLLENTLGIEKLKESCHLLIRKIRDLSSEIRDQIIPHSKLLKREKELLFYAECGVCVDSAVRFVYDGYVSEATLLIVFKKITSFTLHYVDYAICKEYSSELILLMLQKVDFKEEKMSEGQDLLQRALQYNHSDAVIMLLMKNVEYTSEHLEIALWHGYKESIINLMFEKLKDQPFSNENPDHPRRLASGAFFADTAQQGKSWGETNHTYSEQLICKILGKLEKLDPFDFECALFRKFSDSNLKDIIDNIDQITSRELQAANETNVSDDILKLMIPKVKQLDWKISWYERTEEVFEMALDRNVRVSEHVLNKAICNLFSEKIIKKILARLDKVESNTINKAQEQGYSKELIDLLKAKCPNWDSFCIIS